MHVLVDKLFFFSIQEMQTNVINGNNAGKYIIFFDTMR